MYGQKSSVGRAKTLGCLDRFYYIYSCFSLSLLLYMARSPRRGGAVASKVEESWALRDPCGTSSV
jgi:hypothetical protein